MGRSGCYGLCVRVCALAAIVLIALGLEPARAQSLIDADTFQPWHAVMYRSVLWAEVSPDGRYIAFLRSQPRRPIADDSGAAWVELYLLDAEGREVPFVTGKVNIGRPTWISDDELAFLATRDGEKGTQSKTGTV